MGWGWTVTCTPSVIVRPLFFPEDRMVDTQRVSLSPKFEENHPAIEALKDDIEDTKTVYEELAGELAEREGMLEKAEAEYKLARSSVEVTRAGLQSNERRQAALRDAIEYLTGKKP